MTIAATAVEKQKSANSRLSHGAKNISHKTYLSNERKINTALCKGIAQRRSDLHAKEIYTAAGITSPTFYLHHRNVQEAMASYEEDLEQSLRDRMPKDPKREIVYTILTSYIAKNRKYFLAAAQGRNYYLLDKIVTSYRFNLVGDKIDDRMFRHYVGTIIVVINCWLEYDDITKETTQGCYEKLIKIRPMRWS